MPPPFRLSHSIIHYINPPRNLRDFNPITNFHFFFSLVLNFFKKSWFLNFFLCVLEKMKNPLRLKSVNHISIVCNSVEKSVDFYQKVLGFYPVKRPASFNFHGAWYCIYIEKPFTKLLCFLIYFVQKLNLLIWYFFF